MQNSNRIQVQFYSIQNWVTKQRVEKFNPKQQRIAWKGVYKNYEIKYKGCEKLIKTLHEINLKIFNVP